MNTRFIDWRTILELEPCVAQIIADARSVSTKSASFWTSYGRLKRRLNQYVGWNARRPELRGEVAYELAMKKLIEAMEAPAT